MNRVMTAIGRAMRRRNARVRGGTLRMARAPLCCRSASGFASTVMRRYATWQAVQAFMEMILRRSLPAVILRSFYQQSHVHVAPRFPLTVVTGQVGGADEAVPSGPLTSPPRVHGVIETLVRRLTAREARIEAVPVTGPASLGEVVTSVSASVAAAAGPMPLIVYRTPSGGTHGSHIERVPGPPRPRPADCPRPKAPSDVDISHLTDKVMQAMDRRIVAYRERTGRA
jgi:hypothetical protein